MSTITVIGFLSDDPDLRFQQSGVPVCNFRIGENTAKRGEQANWANYRCVAFGQLAENIAGSLVKGDRVLVIGSMEEREYGKQDGSTGRSLQLIVGDCAPALRFANAEVERNPRKDDR